MSELVLRAERRSAAGSAVARRMRAEGKVPATVYGQRSEPLSVAVDARELRAALATEAGLNAIITLRVNGDSITTLPRELQRNPVRGDIIHLDFLRISLTEVVEVEVALEFAGEPVGVKEHGGIIEAIRNAVAVEALPTAIPPHITFDVSGLDIGDVLRVEDLPVLEGVTYLDEPDTSLVTVALPRVEVEAVVEVEEEVAEGEELGVAEEAGVEEDQAAGE